jgi:hypothetical protein
MPDAHLHLDLTTLKASSPAVAEIRASRAKFRQASERARSPAGLFHKSGQYIPQGSQREPKKTKKELAL